MISALSHTLAGSRAPSLTSVDPRVHALVTMLSSTPMTPEGFHQAFLAILQVHGFVAVPEGNVIKILPNPSAL
jgi:general secretion pathway protein D